MNQIIWDVTLWMLASPIYLVQWLARLIRRWRFWRIAYVPAITCGVCGSAISLVGMWQCRCGYQAVGHLMRFVPCARACRVWSGVLSAVLRRNCLNYETYTTL